MRKKISVMFAVLVFILCLNTLCACNNDGDDNQNNVKTYTEGLSFELNTDGLSYSVSGIGTATDTDIIIPETHEGLPVTGINSSSFSYCTDLASVTIPRSIIYIGNTSFIGCSKLASVTFGEESKLESIGSYAFYGCSNLKEVHISDIAAWCNISFAYDHDANPLYYAKNLYLNGSLITELVIPKGVTKIPSYAFYYQSSITKVTIPDSVTSIGEYAFNNCSSLTSITIPDSVTSIGKYAFRGCSSLENITVDSGNTVYHSAGNCIIETESKTLVIGCKNSIIPTDNSVTSIGYGAFSGCSSLASITIPDSVTSIDDSAFLGCSSLTSITIPDSVTSILSSAFLGCSSLTSITIPDSVTFIGNHAFYNCSSLESITIPDSVTSIGKSAFEGCSSLESVTFGENSKLKSIGYHAFSGCSSLTSITIPDSVTFIGMYAFYDCYKLERIDFTGTVAEWEAISKDSYWDNGTGEYTVYCTDGNVSKDGNVTYN